MTKENKKWVFQWPISIILALKRLEQEDHEFKANLGYMDKDLPKGCKVLGPICSLSLSNLNNNRKI